MRNLNIYIYKMHNLCKQLTITSFLLNFVIYNKIQQFIANDN